jgi:hypothetical protein
MPAHKDGLTLAVARGGWVRVDGLDGPYDLYVRYRYKTNEAGGIVDYATNSAGEVIRSGRLAATEVVLQINHHTSSIDVGTWRSVPIARLETLANLPDVKAALIDQMLDPEADVEIGVSRPEQFEPVLQAPVTRRALRLPKPTGKRYSDDFYKRVAEAYYAAVMLLDSADAPATAVAEANGVSTSVVRRWFAEARRRGFLAPAQSMGRIG